ncbi:response regulator transcription factor [Emticicia sp. C21]|uniref:response regulator transcription factor n=1 Tax=Emticicia sp. C21 TaxID=2302915 RepID=UPI000E34FD31|nr:response regulator transcription factor [Emticicia sp. C21]RFS15049.1 DNA-binding response regulator [Emticicia sp. C21]
MEKKNILVIEDDRRISDNLVKGLQKNGFLTDVAFDGHVGLRKALSEPFDLVILDINLPLMNGFDVCFAIRGQKPSLPILMLTALGEIEDKVEGLDNGADDYIVKPFDFRELFARVNALLRRNSQAPVKAIKEVLRVADLEIHLDKKVAVRSGKMIDLTAREFALLEYLIRNRGRVLSKMDIAENVWDLNFDSSTNIIEVYINYLRKKIDKDFDPKLIHTKSGLGYVLREE